jgi:hypothetical protein
MIHEGEWSNWWIERRLQGKPKNSEKTCPSATLSHHKSHMTRSGFEPQTAAVGSQRLTAWAMARPAPTFSTVITVIKSRKFEMNFTDCNKRYVSYKGNMNKFVPCHFEYLTHTGVAMIFFRMGWQKEKFHTSICFSSLILFLLIVLDYSG